MLRGLQRVSAIAFAMLLALLPLIELVDHWESYGSDPEFVSVCTILAIAFGFLLLFRRAILYALSRVLTSCFSLNESAMRIHFLPDSIQEISPRIRAPIRI